MGIARQTALSMVFALVLIIAGSTTDAAVILTRMSGDSLTWDGVVPNEDQYAWQADVYLTDDYEGGIVWIRSDYQDQAWVVNASPMGMPDHRYLFGDGLELELFGTKPTEGAIVWWPKEHNPENYVTSLRANGRLFEVAPGAIVPEPGRILTIGLAIALVMIWLGVRA